MVGVAVGVGVAVVVAVGVGVAVAVAVGVVVAVGVGVVVAVGVGVGVGINMTPPTDRLAEWKSESELKLQEMKKVVQPESWLLDLHESRLSLIAELERMHKREALLCKRVESAEEALQYYNECGSFDPEFLGGDYSRLGLFKKARAHFEKYKDEALKEGE